MNLLNITIWSMKMQFNHYRHRLTGVNNKALIMKNKLNQGSYNYLYILFIKG